MSRVDAPAVAVGRESSPPERPEQVGRWRGAAAAGAALFVASQLLPWQRVCEVVLRVDAPSRRCFDARGWQGTAALLGMVAIGAAALILVLAARRRDPLGGTGLAWAVLGCFLGAGGLKVAMAHGQASTWGCWFGEAGLGVSGIAAWELVRGRSRSSRTAPRPQSGLLLPASISVVAVVAVAIPYLASGLGRWGGPLAAPYFAEAGGAHESLLVPADRQVLANGTAFIRNESGVSVRLDGLELVGASPAIHVDGAFLYRNPRSARCHEGLAGGSAVTSAARQCLRPLGGAELPPRPTADWDLAILPVVRITQPGWHSIDGFFVRYSVGPLHYRVFVAGSVSFCAGRQGRPDSYRACR